jgi:hypothetical protein
LVVWNFINFESPTVRFGEQLAKFLANGVSDELGTIRITLPHDLVKLISQFPWYPEGYDVRVASF